MAFVHSVNVGMARPISTKSGSTGIDKIPASTPVTVFDPGLAGAGTSGLVGDTVCDVQHHGGGDQAVYAYAREDLNWWQDELGTPLRSGMFGENLTTGDLEVSGALIGETWRIGARVVLQVTSPRVPCSTFAAWMNRPGWLKSFTRVARPGAYLRVLTGGEIRAGDPVVVEGEPSSQCLRIGPVEAEEVLVAHHVGVVGGEWGELDRRPRGLSAGGEARPTLESDSMILLYSHVRTGRWASVMPAKIADTLGLTDTIRAIPITQPEAVQTIGLVVPSREPMTPITAALVAEARRVAASLDD